MGYHPDGMRPAHPPRAQTRDMSATLSDTQLGELLELTQHTDSVELKLTIDEPHTKTHRALEFFSARLG